LNSFLRRFILWLVRHKAVVVVAFLFLVLTAAWLAYRTGPARFLPTALPSNTPGIANPPTETGTALPTEMPTSAPTPTATPTWTTSLPATTASTETAIPTLVPSSTPVIVIAFTMPPTWTEISAGDRTATAMVAPTRTTFCMECGQSTPVP